MVEEHETLLRGASFAGGGEAPILLQRTDDDPVGVLLEKLGRAEGRAELAASLAADRDPKSGLLRLFQPVHRTWHLALLEVACDAPGRPRLDPKRIESAGLVIRRVDATGALQGWRRVGRTLRGWLPFDPSEAHFDPDPKKRQPAVRSGHAEIDRLLLLRAGEPLEESVSPLFVAPPEVCKAVGKTLLYGLVPVTSAEHAEAPAGLGDLDEDAFGAAVDGNLSVLLKGAHKRGRGRRGYSWLGQTLTSASAAGNGDLGADLKTLTACLEQLDVQLAAFEPGSAVLALLNQIPLPYGCGCRPAGEVLAEAAGVFLFRTRENVTLPDAWPEISPDLRLRIVDAAVAAMKDRLRLLTAGEGRYDASLGRYVAEAFARVKSHHPGCPAKLVWTRLPSQLFTIVPWYEAGSLPPTRVVLPDLKDGDALRKLKPNVVFILPKELNGNIDSANLKDLADGKHAGAAGLDVGWICGFNIPLITLCAFFVLNIFLPLLKIAFSWMVSFSFALKICIPYPRKK